MNGQVATASANDRLSFKRLKFFRREAFMYGANEVADFGETDWPRYIRITDIRDDGSLYDEDRRALSPDVAAPYLLEDGDVLFARSGATVGKTFLYRSKFGPACFAGYLIRFRGKKSEIDSEFLKYLTETSIYDHFIRQSTIQSTIQNVSAERYGELLVPVLSVTRQRAVVSVLDAKLGRLDELMRKKERQLELLAEKRQALISHAVTRGLNPNAPTKPSDLSWLGDIPAHWQVKRIKYLVTKIGSGKTPLGGSSVYSTEGVMFLRSQNVHDEGFRLDDVVYISDTIDEELSTSRLEPNDILLNITGASIGRVCKFPAGMPRANVNQHVCILRPHHRFAPDYLTFALQSQFTKHQIFAGETGTSREGLNFEQVGNMVVVGPFQDREEQIVIAKALERNLSALAGAATKLSEQIAKLYEYRQTLITAAVTGQVAIPEEVA